MKTLSEKYKIKVPTSTVVLFSKQKQIITVRGPVKQKSLKIRVKLLFLQDKNLIIVTKTPFSTISNNEKKKIKALQGTTVALIKQLFIETSTKLYQKLKLIGVGYKTLNVENFEQQILMFKLGYSHLIYFKIPKDLKIFCLKQTKMFVSGNSYQRITQTAALVQSYKTPEPYKGKGILYEDQKITLKEGKKV